MLAGAAAQIEQEAAVSDYEGISGASPREIRNLLLDAARPCLRQAWIRRTNASHMHLIADNLTRRRDRPLSLFDNPKASERALAVARLKAAVSAKPDSAGPAAEKHTDPNEKEIPVSLKQRAFPLIELLERAAKRECEVMWR